MPYAFRLTLTEFYFSAFGFFTLGSIFIGDFEQLLFLAIHFLLLANELLLYFSSLYFCLTYNKYMYIFNLEYLFSFVKGYFIL